jgi:uncharacterized protein
MFKEDRDELSFSWDQLGDIAEGRPNLGDLTSVTAYRLMQYSLRDVLIRRLDPETAGEIFQEAGRRAGMEFCKNALRPDLDVNEFVADLQQKLKDYRIGIMRVEEVVAESLDMSISVAEDIDCSGLPMSNETICHFDEGFIAGILEAYTGRPFDVREIDCWASGERVCRFQVTAKG